MTIRFINVKSKERTSRGLMGRDKMTREQATIALQTGKLVTCKIGEEILIGTIKTTRPDSETYLQFQGQSKGTDPLLAWVGPEELEFAQ